MNTEVALRTGGRAEEYDFAFIGTERYRKYIYPDGQEVKINEPMWLHVSDTGGHRVLDASEHCHFIAPGFRHIIWSVFDDQPHFVK